VGLLDVLLGRTKPVRANLDALFALPSAAVTLQASAGLLLSSRAGVCWSAPAGQSATDVQKDISQLLEMPDDTTTPAPATPGVGSLTQVEDAYGYRWLLLEDPDTDNLVTRVHLVNSTLTDNGWGPQLLCSVFGLVPGPDSNADTHPLFLVYLYKRGTFYPFAPDGKEHRDNELELRIRAVLGSDLPVEPDLSRWFPLWDLPLR